MVIALTHQWTKNDVDFAANVPGVDLVLGGHDHVTEIQACKNSSNQNKDIPLIKSGSEFHDLSIIDISFGIDETMLNLAKTKAAESTEAQKPQVLYAEGD